MRWMFQLCLLLLVLLSAETRAWGRAHAGQNIASGGPPLILVDCADPDAPPTLITQGEPGPCGYEPAPDVRDGPNLYAYVKQNPWTAFDPDGLKTKQDHRDDKVAAQKQYEKEVGAMTKYTRWGEAAARGRRDMKWKASDKAIAAIEKTAADIHYFSGQVVDSETLNDESAHYKSFTRSVAFFRANPEHQTVEALAAGRYKEAAKRIGISALLTLAGGKLLQGPAKTPAGVSYRLGSPVAEIPRYEWAMMSHEARIASVVEKYGINLRGRQVVFDPKLGTGQLGMTAQANPMTMRVGSGVMNSETELAATIAHELRHSRAYMGSGANTEAAAEASENALRSFIQGNR